MGRHLHSFFSLRFLASNARDHKFLFEKAKGTAEVLTQTLEPQAKGKV